MQRKSAGLNEDVAKIVTQVLGDLSLEQAALRLGYGLSRTAISDLKRGKVGREETVRTFAEGFHERICDQFGDDVRTRFGDCTSAIASDWLAEKAGFGLRYSRRKEDLTYEPVMEEIDLAGYPGAENLDPSDIKALNDIVRAFIDSKRQSRG